MNQLRERLADRRALRAELRSGDGWIDYRRRRRGAKRAIRAERREHGRGSHVEPGTSWSDAWKAWPGR